MRNKPRSLAGGHLSVPFGERCLENTALLCTEMLGALSAPPASHHHLQDWSRPSGDVGLFSLCVCVVGHYLSLGRTHHREGRRETLAMCLQIFYVSPTPLRNRNQGPLAVPRGLGACSSLEVPTLERYTGGVFPNILPFPAIPFSHKR